MKCDRTMIYKRTLNTYGIKSQVDVCIEECSELIKALLKLRRADTNIKCDECKNNILEEIADVQIMLEQMRLIYGNTKKQENHKIKRLAARVKEGVINDDNQTIS